MQTSKTLARLYCPNPKDPTEGLRQKANGVWAVSYTHLTLPTT